MDKLLSLAKRRGFLFQSSEIYGGLNATWDYGPLGAQLKRNVKDAWWRSILQLRDDTVAFDARHASEHPRHLAGQRSPRQLHRPPSRVPLLPSTIPRRSHRLQGLSQLSGANSPTLVSSTSCSRPSWAPSKTPPPKSTSGPETAQGIYVNFKNVLNSARRKLPFGIAQIGKAFRNEITPGNSTFRTREFEIMELEFFVKPGTDDDWLQYWVEQRLEWFVSLGVDRNNLRLRKHESDELAHYAKEVYDIEYRFPWGWAELEGIANRTDFDLRQHAEHSGHDLTYFDDQAQERYYPYVIEPSCGADRAALAFLIDAYREETVPPAKPTGKTETRNLLRLHRSLAPVTVAILPLSRNQRLVPTARRVDSLIRQRFNTLFDDAQSIGRRYRRQDEIGTPFCVTVDFDTLDDEQVTLRDRDTMVQLRIPINRIVPAIEDKLRHGW